MPVSLDQEPRCDLAGCLQVTISHKVAAVFSVRAMISSQLVNGQQESSSLQAQLNASLKI